MLIHRAASRTQRAWLILGAIMVAAGLMAGVQRDARASAPDLGSQVTAGRLDQSVLDAVQRGETVDAILVYDDAAIQLLSASRRRAGGLSADSPQLIALRAQDYAALKSGVAMSASASVLDDYANLALQHISVSGEASLASLLAHPAVAAVRENRLQRSDALATSLPLINQPAAAALGKTGQNTAVAILDTGVDYTNAAFGTCTATTPPAAPGNPSGTCKVAWAQDFTPADDGSRDANGHGTNVAGIVVAVAPSTKILALDVFQGGGAYDADIIRAINWVISTKSAYGTASINMSLGDGAYWISQCTGSSYTSPFTNLRTAGVLPVVASGNGANGLGTSATLGISGPACTPGAISVGAVYDDNLGGIGFSSCSDPTTAADKITCFSQTASYLSVLAPGSNMTAAGVGPMYGTSQATPHVAGTVAVLAGAMPSATPAAIESAISGSGPSIFDSRAGAAGVTKHRLDVCAALNTLGVACGGGGGGAPPPSIGSLSPSSATAGGAQFTLTVNGANFVSGATVRWNGLNRATSFSSAAVLTATIPATDIASATTASVTVANPDAQVSNAANFTVNASGGGGGGPTITAIIPSSRAAGTGQFGLTVNGSGFTYGSTLKWNGNPRTTVWLNPSMILAIIPAGDTAVPTTATVTITSPTGQVSNVVFFTVTGSGGGAPPPSMSSLSPTSTVAGSAQFTLTVNGANFVSGATVLWNGATRTTSFVGSGQLTATIPATDVASTGSATVTVRNPDNQLSGGATFTISPVAAPAPSISSLSPASKVAGSSQFTLTVNGANFVSGASVKWNGSARTTTFVNSGQVTATINASDVAAAGTATVTVVNPDLQPSGGATFSITPPPPSISSLSPTSKAAGSGQFTLTVNGANFVSGATVNWNGSGRTTTFVNSGQLTATVLAGDVAVQSIASVTVTNPDAQISGPVSFTVTAAGGTGPVITALIPGSRAAGSGQFGLAISGSNFQYGCMVFWNGSYRPTVWINNTTVFAIIYAGDVASPGTASVVLQNPGGAASAPVTFTIN